MNQSKFRSLFFYAFIAVFIISCSGGGNEEKNNTDSTATDTTAVNTAPATNNIITTPENMMLVKHRVSNFEKWKTSFEARDSVREAIGIHNYVIGRGLKDSNLVL